MKPRKKPAIKSPKDSRKANYGQYVSTTQSGARRVLYAAPATDQRKELQSYTRLQMVAKSRWAERNSPTYKAVIDELCIVTVGDGLTPESHVQNAETAKAYQDYFNAWARRPEVTGRFTFGKVQELLLRSLIGDGDVFVLKTLVNGKPAIQIIEGHRVGSPREKNDPTCVDGAYLGTYGEVKGWNVYVDGDQKNKYRDAKTMLQVVDLERASGVRGMPVMQASFNSVQDQLEIFDLEKRAVRDSADHTLILKKQGGILQDDPAASFAGNSSACNQLADQMGGKLLVVDTNESFEQLVNSRPSPAWHGMMKAIQADIVKLLPVEYVADPSAAGGAGVRLIASKVSRVAGKYQNILIDTSLDDIWDFVIGFGIDNGDLPEDPDFRLKSWITPRDVTVDAGREAAQDRADLEMGLTTAQAIVGKKGTTVEKVVNARVKEMTMIVDACKKAGLPLWMLYKGTNNHLQQGQGMDQISSDVADNLDVPEDTTP